MKGCLPINERMTTCRSQCDGDPTHIYVGADRRRHFGRLLVGDRLPGLPNQSERQSCKALRGADPQIFWGRKRSKKNQFEIMGASNAHRNLVREMGPECRCAVRNASATRVGVCVRRVGCKTYTCSPPQTATLPEGVRHVMGKSGGAWGFAARAQTAEGCTTHAVVPHA